MLKRRKNIYLTIFLSSLMLLNLNNYTKAEPNLFNSAILIGADTKAETKNEVPTDEITKKYDFNLVQELILGRAVAYGLLEKFNNKICTDEKLNNYVNLVGQSVAKSASKRPQVKYRFGIIDSDEINAFACPGGYIFVTTGLLKILSNENELASVLGHEIGHVEHGDGLKDINEHRKDEFSKLKVDKLEKEFDTIHDVVSSLPYASSYTPANLAKSGINSAIGSIGGYGGIAASLTLGTASGYAVDAAAKGLKGLVKIFAQKAIERWYYQPLTPEIEFAADAFSADAMMKIGYNPIGLTNLLETMKDIGSSQSENKANNAESGSKSLFTYRHPPIAERITKIDDLMSKNQFPDTIDPEKKAVFKSRFRENSAIINTN